MKLLLCLRVVGFFLLINGYCTPMARAKKALVAAAENVEESLDALESKLLLATKAEAEKDSYASTVALVRQSNGLAEGEIAVLAARHSKIKEALEKMLGMALTDAQVPKIAFCCSGGGYRAMISTLGFLKGAETIGLLDAASYAVGLSGSTWALAPWMYRDLPLADYAAQLVPKLAVSFIDEPIKWSNVKKTLFKKLVHGQQIGLVDIWGAKIINKLAGDFPNGGQEIKISDLVDRVKEGKYPFPIFTSAMVPEGEADPQKYEFFEHTPYEVGCPYLNAYVPTWSFGRTFKNGKSQDFAPELSLGYGLGIFGSAFTASLREGLSDLKKKLGNGLLAKEFLKEVETTSFGNTRLSPARIHNIARGIEGNPVAKNKETINIDAGIPFNLPFAACLDPRRHVNIIVVCDASATIKNAPALKGAVEYAQRKGIKFPAIDFKDIDKRPMSIFRNEKDSSVPVVIYFPRILNPAYKADFDPSTAAYCSTENFVYTPEQFENLRGLFEFAVVSNKDALVEALKASILARVPANS